MNGKKEQQLAADSLGIGKSIAMGTAGSAPAFSVSAATAPLVITVGILAPANILYCGLVMFGISLAFIHLNKVLANAGASMFILLLPKPLQWAVARVVDLAILVFAVAIIPGAWDYVVGSIGERARSINVPMIWVYVVTLIIPVSLAFFSIARLAGLGRDTQPPSHGETV